MYYTVFYYLLNKLFARSRCDQNQLNLLVEKIGKKLFLNTEKRAQNVTLSNLKFSVRQIAKKMKVSETAVYNAIMKYQNEGRPSFTTSREASGNHSLSDEYCHKNSG